MSEIGAGGTGEPSLAVTRQGTHRWPAVAVDLASALGVLLIWNASMAWWRSQGWLPRHTGAWALTGWALAIAVAIRRIAPAWLLCALAVAYPLLYHQPLRNDLHLAPILVLGFAAAQRRATLAALAASTLAVLLFFSPIVDSNARVNPDWRRDPGRPTLEGPGVRGPWAADWSAVVVAELATVAIVLLGASSAAQRASARSLAAQNEELERLRHADAQRAADEERLRISRELHDVVAHHLTAILMRAQAADHVAARQPEVAVDAVGWIAHSSREALAATRQTVSSLRDERVQQAQTTLLVEIAELAERMADIGVAVTAEVDEQAVQRLEPAADLVARRVVREAMTNTLKHGDGGRARVRVWGDDGGVAVAVTDDGRSRRSSAATGPGTGLIGLRERVEALGGRFEAGPAQRGWEVRAWLPNA